MKTLTEAISLRIMNLLDTTSDIQWQDELFLVGFKVSNIIVGPLVWLMRIYYDVASLKTIKNAVLEITEVFSLDSCTLIFLL